MSVFEMFIENKDELIKYARKMIYVFQLQNQFDAEEICHDACIRIAERAADAWTVQYMKRSVYYRMIDEYRRRREVDIDGEIEKFPQPEIQNPSFDPDCLKRFNDFFLEIFRQLEIGFRATEHQGQIDWFAVLLLDIRLIFHGIMRNELESPEALRVETVSSIIEKAVPWTTVQSELRFKDGWPEIDMIWGWLRDDIDAMKLITAARLVETFNRNASEDKRLNPNLWYAWVNRARARTHGMKLPQLFFRLIDPSEAEGKTGGRR